MDFKKVFPFFLIFVFSLFALLFLFKPGFVGWDFIFQCARLASFYKNLKEGVVLPRWAGTLNADFGHPVLIFLYPFVFYLGSFWHFLGFSLVDSIKIVLGLGYLFSGIFMYLAIRKVWGRRIGLAAALFYLFIPYRFLNLYGRAALGEHLAVTFLPLVFLSLANILTSKKAGFKNSLFLAVSLALTILSHNLVVLLSLPLVLAWIIYLIVDTFVIPAHAGIYKNNLHRFLIHAKGRAGKSGMTKKIFHLIAGFFLGLGLSSFFWMPVLLERKYTRYDEIANPTYYKISLLKSKQIFIPANFPLPLGELQYKPEGDNIVYPTIAPTQWFLIFFGFWFVFKFFKKKKKEAFFVLFLVLYSLLGAFLSLEQSFFLTKLLPQIALFQQAVRFFNLPLIAAPFLLAIIAQSLPKRKIGSFLICFSLLNLIFSLPFFWNLKLPRKFKDDNYFYEEYKLTADTGQITPRWSLINYYEKAPQRVQLVSGGLDEVKIEKWHSQEHLYTLKIREDSQIADNTLYFPGWKVWVDGRQVSLRFQDMNWRGIITYPVPKGEWQIKVKFTETKLRLLADYISLASLVILFGLFLKSLALTNNPA